MSRSSSFCLSHPYPSNIRCGPKPVISSATSTEPALSPPFPPREVAHRYPLFDLVAVEVVDFVFVVLFFFVLVITVELVIVVVVEFLVVTEVLVVAVELVLFFLALRVLVHLVVGERRTGFFFDSPLLLHGNLTGSGTRRTASHDATWMRLARERCASFPKSTGSIRSAPPPSIRNEACKTGSWSRSPKQFQRIPERLGAPATPACRHSAR